jgi:hypothetical protein
MKWVSRDGYRRRHEKTGDTHSFKHALIHFMKNGIIFK